MDVGRGKGHFDAVRKEYEDLEGVRGVNTTPALRLVFDRLAVRYNACDRSEGLYMEMMAVE